MIFIYNGMQKNIIFKNIKIYDKLLDNYIALLYNIGKQYNTNHGKEDLK